MGPYATVYDALETPSIVLADPSVAMITAPFWSNVQSLSTTFGGSSFGVLSCNDEMIVSSSSILEYMSELKFFIVCLMFVSLRSKSDIIQELQNCLDSWVCLKTKYLFHKLIDLSCALNPSSHGNFQGMWSDH